MPSVLNITRYQCCTSVKLSILITLALFIIEPTLNTFCVTSASSGAMLKDTSVMLLNYTKSTTLQGFPSQYLSKDLVIKGYFLHEAVKNLNSQVLIKDFLLRHFYGNFQR